ncbi:MAG: ABC transporter ATP-binding protein [Bryobacteraceae bacterium]|nr:ABC transporter ATP-binding protein [Bryobacteraceae bacterium]MDW8377878.1 ABC transporter ATP-binding protein [Bryobacterales bacterium]
MKKRFPPSAKAAGFLLEVDVCSTAAVTAFFGASGAGKTLALDALAGFLRPDEGRIMLGDDLVFDGATNVHLKPQQRRCGYVFQTCSLFPHLTVRQNLEFAAEFRPKLERYRRVNEMMERLRLDELAGRRPAELSLEQKKLCTLARALLSQPRLLLLDDPSSGLDPSRRAQLHATLREIQRDLAIPMVVASRDFATCHELAQRLFVFHQGRILQQGAPEEIFDRPASAEVARLLGVYNLLPAEVLTLDPGRNRSSIQFDGYELTGPYLPGKFKGDRVWLCVRPEEIRVLPRAGRPAVNQVPVDFQGATARPGAVRLSFSRGILADMPREEYEQQKHHKEWLVEFPSTRLRVL